jgi:hypothetical protein
MVVQGGFKVELVEASTRVAFTEHLKDGQVYAEVEPEAEYFISFQQVARLPKESYLVLFYVDGNSIGWCYPVEEARQTIDAEPQIVGLYSNENGVWGDRALKFVKPRINAANHDTPPPCLMGKVEVYVYEGEVGEAISTKPRTSKVLGVPSVDAGINSSKATMKNVRSGEGSTLLPARKPASRPKKPASRPWVNRKLVEVITLHYCATPGLIHVGVLPKPDIYTHHRIMTGKKRPAVDPRIAAISPKRICRWSSTIGVDGKETTTPKVHNDLFDLTNIPSDDEGED